MACKRWGLRGAHALSIHRVGQSDIHEAMVRLADGDRSAAHSLVAALWPVLCAFARRAVGNPDDAEDIAQECLIKVAAQISDFDPTRDGLAWALAIAAFEVKSHRKRIQRRREVVDHDSFQHLADAGLSPEESLLDEDLRSALRLALAQLTQDDCDAIAMNATAAPTAPTTLRKRRQRAIHRLKAVWRELYG